MQHSFDFLKNFENYFLNETALKDKKELERLEYNYIKAKAQLDYRKNSMDSTLFASRLLAAKTYLESLSLTHNTNLESIISIIQTKSIMCLDYMDAMNIFYEPSNSVYEMNREMWSYIYLTLGGSSWQYGMYELCFDRSIEEQPGAAFLPNNVVNYETYNVKDNMMDMSNWREYLSECIALNYEQPSSYFIETPLHLRPQFLFDGQLSLSKVNTINCATPLAFSALTSSIKKVFGGTHEILKIIKLSTDFKGVFLK